MGLRLQVDIQDDAQALQLVGQQLVARLGAAQFLVIYVDLTLHGLGEKKQETRVVSLPDVPPACSVSPSCFIGEGTYIFGKRMYAALSDAGKIFQLYSFL